MDEKMLTPEQVAQILQIHQFTVLKFIKQQRLKASKIGRVYRIRESDLEEFLEETANGKSKSVANKKNTQVKEVKNKKQKQSSFFSSPADPFFDSTGTGEEKKTVESIDYSEDNTKEENGNYYILQ